MACTVFCFGVGNAMCPGPRNQSPFWIELCGETHKFELQWPWTPAPLGEKEPQVVLGWHPGSALHIIMILFLKVWVGVWDTVGSFKLSFPDAYWKYIGLPWNSVLVRQGLQAGHSGVIDSVWQFLPQPRFYSIIITPETIAFSTCSLPMRFCILLEV